MTESTEEPQASTGTSPADSDHEGGSAAPDEQSIAGVDDDQLPEDLQPTDDNPLAQPLDPEDENTKDLDELDMDATQDGADDGTDDEEPEAADTDSAASAEASAEEDSSGS